MADDWIAREVLRGLQGLVVLRLEGAPSADAVSMTADIWLAAVARRARGWREGSDAPRVRRAFEALFAQSRRWPSPADFLDALPAPARPTALPAPKLGEAEREQGRARISALMDKFFNAKRMR